MLHLGVLKQVSKRRVKGKDRGTAHLEANRKVPRRKDIATGMNKRSISNRRHHLRHLVREEVSKPLHLLRLVHLVRQGRLEEVEVTELCRHRRGCEEWELIIWKRANGTEGGSKVTIRDS